MIDKVQRIRKEVQRLQNELIQEKKNGFGSDVDDACILELQNVLTFIDSLQEEPISEDLEEEAIKYAKEEYNHKNHATLPDRCRGCYTPLTYAFKAGAKWQKEHLLKSADGDDLPEIDREVIALLDNGKVVYAHRPSAYWDGKNIDTDKVTRYYPKTYGKGGWNGPDVKYWLDVKLPKEIEL